MRLTLALVALLSSVSIASAQSFEGNWSCSLPTGERTGILTIYGSSFGYAARGKEAPGSGIGSVTRYEDGVTFDNGPLNSVLKISIGRLVPNEDTGVSMQLESENAIALTCTALPDSAGL